MNTNAVFHLMKSEISQRIAPASEVFQNFSDSARKKDMASIAAVHHSLRHVDARAHDVDVFLDVRMTAHGAGMHAQAQADIRVIAKRAGDLQSTGHGQHGAAQKNQSHSVAGGNHDQLGLGLRLAEGCALPDDCLQQAKHFALTIDASERIADQVHEEHRRHFAAQRQ